MSSSCYFHLLRVDRLSTVLLSASSATSIFGAFTYVHLYIYIYIISMVLDFTLEYREMLDPSRSFL